MSNNLNATPIIPAGSITSALVGGTSDSMPTRNQSPGDDRIMLRLNVTNNLLNKLCGDAHYETNNDTKIRLFTSAKQYSEKMFETLGTLQASTLKEGKLQEQNGIYAQILMEVTEAYLSKAKMTPNLGEKMKSLRLAKEESQKVFKALKKLSSFDPNVLEQQKRLKVQISIDLMQCHCNCIDAIESGEEKIRHLNIALKENKIALNELSDMAAMDAHEKRSLHSVLSDALLLKRKLEHLECSAAMEKNDAVFKVMEKLAMKPKEPAEKELTLEYQEKIDAFLEKNEVLIDLQRGIFDTCKTLLSPQHASSYSHGEQIEFSSAKEVARSKLNMSTILSSQHRIGAALSRLEHLFAETPSDINNFAMHWVRQYERKGFLLIGTFSELTSPLAEKKAVAPPDDQKREILSSLATQLDDFENDAQWMAGLFALHGKPKADIDQVEMLVVSAKEFAAVIRFELENIKEILDGKKKPGKHKKSHLSTDMKNARKGSSAEIKTAPANQVSEKSSSRQLREPTAQFVTTKFDGKLMGSHDGNFFLAKDVRGDAIKYRQEGDAWIRHEQLDEDVDATIHEVEQLLKEEALQEKSYKRIIKELGKAINKVNEWREGAIQNKNLAAFAERNDAPFYKSIGIFNLACYQQGRAIATLEKFVSRLEAHALQNGDLNAHLDDVKHLLATVRQEAHEMKAGKIEAVKNQAPSGPGLSFLLDENQVVNIVKTQNRITLKRERIDRNGVTRADYMDEQKIYVKGITQPFVLHVHFHSNAATADENTACHLKYAGEDGNDVHSPVALSLLRRLNEFIPAGATRP